MSTVKISQLPELLHLDTNTANTILIGVDVSSCVTSQFTVETLAEGLYANNVLNVGNNEILFPGVIAQFVGNNETYLQLMLENNNGNGSGDIVVTADTGTDTTNYINMGINGSTFADEEFGSMKPLDGYLIVTGVDANTVGGNLVIGTSTPNKVINFIAGGTANSDIIIRMTAAAGLELLQKPVIFADGTSQNTSSLSAGVYANGAFIQSNAAFLQANTTSGVANSAALYANGAFVQANAAFLQANTTSGVANSSALYANGAFVQANAAFIKANTPPAIANSAALYANGAFVQANAAFTKANNALANATGTFAGDLTITGNTFAQAMNTTNMQVVGTANVSGTLDVRGVITGNAKVVLSNTNFTATEAALTISASPSVQDPVSDGYMIHISGKNGIPARIVTDSYGTGAYSVYASRTARGNVTNPSAVQTGDIIGRFSASGYGTTKFQQYGTGRIDFIATENYTDANTGSQIKFWNCAPGSNTLINILTLNGSSAEFTGVVKADKGFIYTPRILQGAQTAITIDFATDSMIRGTFSSTLTNSLSNYVAGKVVEMWLTNTAGNGQTVVHGGLANNTTTGATSISVAAGRSVQLKYFSVDGDLANTFVAVTYA